MFGKKEEFLPGYGAQSRLQEHHLFEWQRDMKTNVSEARLAAKEYKRSSSPTANSTLKEMGAHYRYQETLKGLNQYDFIQKRSSSLTGFQGTAARGITGTANKINDYLARKGRGFIEGGFKTVGEVVQAAPLKSMAMGYGMGLGMMGVVEFGLMGKPVTMSNMFQIATDNVAFTLGSELAGTGFKGIAKYMGWQMLGSEMGLGTWGSLGLQVAGAIALPGLGTGLAAGMLAYKAGKGLYQGAKAIHDLGAASRRTEWTTQDTSWQSQNATTMRERALGAIQNSHLNLRSVLGNEARMLSMAR